jgi:hypothetical protein
MSRTEWLTDNVINAMQVLLREANPAVNGLQDTVLGETLAFEVMRGEFVQVLHSGGNHWITVTNIGCPESSVKVYDSMYTQLPTQTKEQICTLLCSPQPTIDVVYASAQTQGSSFDCGGFALAYASTLCSGQSPEDLLFARECLRPHVLQCLENEVATPFPSRTLQRRKKIRRVSAINIFCKCRTQEGGRMGECSGCGEWYHEECVSFPDSVWINTDYNWLCDDCKPKS